MLGISGQTVASGGGACSNNTDFVVGASVAYPTTGSCDLSGSVSIGDLIVVAVGGNSVTITGVSDDLSTPTSYTALDTITTNGNSLRVFYGIAEASGTPTISSAGTGSHDVWAAAFSGVASTSSLDVSASDVSADWDTSLDSGTIETTEACTLLVGVGYSASGSAGFSTDSTGGATYIETMDGANLGAAHLVYIDGDNANAIESTGTYGNTSTGPNQYWMAYFMAFTAD